MLIANYTFSVSVAPLILVISFLLLHWGFKKQRHIQNLVFQFKAFFSEKLHHRCLIGFWNITVAKDKKIFLEIRS